MGKQQLPQSEPLTKSKECLLGNMGLYQSPVTVLLSEREVVLLMFQV